MGRKSWVLISLYAVALAMMDQFTKWLAQEYGRAAVTLMPGFSLHYAENSGIAWSLPVPRELIIPLSTVLIGVIVVFAAKHVDLRKKISRVFLALILAGALGNLFDRITRGFVVDFISVGWWPVFNVADMFLCIGIFLMVLFYGTIKRVS